MGVAMKDILSRYPRTIEGGLVLRPLEAADEAELIQFFKRMPVDERQLFKDDVTKPEVIHGWIRKLNYSNILPLMVFKDRRIVADATLHRDKHGWSRHVAEVRVSLDPEFRGKGLARMLLEEFIEIGPSLNIAILNAFVLDVQREARDLVEAVGFLQVAVLPQHAIDLAGVVHDVLVYTTTLVPPERLAPEASWSEERADVGGNA
jgi:RimJ/RimL family protein N-acetyltransferase